ncbi:MAG: ATP-dependent DNA helicase RecG [Pirellulales bacterium]|nr:ATP-dependent DNA helicase RecG [Pirellulales bacterium]
MAPPEPTTAELLSTPVQFLPGVGPQRAELLAKLGLKTAADVLFFFPRDYQDFAQVRSVDQLEEGTLQSVYGTVEEAELRDSGGGKCVLGVLFRATDGGFFRGVWFNQPFLLKQFSRGQRMVLSGKPKLNGLFWELIHPSIVSLGDEEPEEPEEGLLPVYPLTEGLRQWHVRRVVRAALEKLTDCLDEVFPNEYLAKHNLWPIRQALPAIHFPEDRAALDKAQRRFVYQELFILQLGVALRRQAQHSNCHAPPLEVTPKIDARIRRLFPFELTAGQQAAIADVAADLGRESPMNRLLQGDVGSGKTVVAVYAMLAAIAHGFQAVLMTPTEVLARQHAQTLGRLLSKSHVRLASLTGGMPAGERRVMLEQIAAGEIDVVVGTHAVLQEDVVFHKLALVVIDEQHKFGVRQRAALRRAGLDPHYLVMTATPIPRTVTMTLFGDLDVSILRDMPPSRQPVKTYLAEPDQRAKWWDFFCRKLREGRQGYVVTPLVEESDQLAATSLDEAYEALVHGPLEAFRVGLIHGRMSSQEKDAVMEDFRSGKLQVLVCTSVVEVGVDVPNATLMTIESGHRFGLAQLHQLRGRIGRGSYPGFCTVFAEPESEEAQKRLDAFVSTTDGFVLAEEDFKLRGPGELFGTRQHGLPPLRVADLTRDEKLLEEARRDAAALVASDPGLALPAHARLQRMVMARYGKVLELADVG